MPNFDGQGPLKRGRVIGRGRGHCRNDAPRDEEPSCSNEPEPENRQQRS